MPSQVEIVNAALTILGESRITSLDEDLKPARESKAIFSMRRDALLGGYNWNFAKTRAQLSADADAPAFGFGMQYTFPTDCLRIIFVGDYYAGVDLTDYRGSQTELFEIEGRKILTDLGAPLNLRYVKRVSDTSLFDPCFAWALSADLAYWLAEPLTQSDTKRERALQALNASIRAAVRANAIQLPPQKLADDEWLLSRL